MGGKVGGEAKGIFRSSRAVVVGGGWVRWHGGMAQIRRVGGGRGVRLVRLVGSGRLVQMGKVGEMPGLVVGVAGWVRVEGDVGVVEVRRVRDLVRLVGEEVWSGGPIRLVGCVNGGHGEIDGELA